MARVKVDAAALQQFLDTGHSQAEAATHFGVSEAAISQRVKQARIATSKIVALERAAQVVDQKLDANARLERVQRVIDEELSWAVAQAKAPSADRAALQDMVLRLAAEVRQQLALQLSISRTLVDLRVVREFQQSVIRTIAEESPEAARRIVDRLKAQRALRQSATLMGLDGSGHFDVA